MHTMCDSTIVSFKERHCLCLNLSNVNRSKRYLHFDICICCCALNYLQTNWWNTQLCLTVWNGMWRVFIRLFDGCYQHSPRAQKVGSNSVLPSVTASFFAPYIFQLFIILFFCVFNCPCIRRLIASIPFQLPSFCCALVYRRVVGAT